MTAMQFLRVHQKLVANPIADIPAAVHAALDGLKLKVPQGDVGITAGSRGIANIAAITKAAGDWLRATAPGHSCFRRWAATTAAPPKASGP